MSLTKCGECGAEVSDKAVSCPKCGYPFEKIRGTENLKDASSKTASVGDKSINAADPEKTETFLEKSGGFLSTTGVLIILGAILGWGYGNIDHPNPVGLRILGGIFGLILVVGGISITSFSKKKSGN